jgi:hypothetical protein
MAQQTGTEWTEAQNANDLAAGDEVRLRNTANDSVELEGRVTDALEGVGTVQVRVGGVRRSEVYAEGDGEWTKRGTCWTYTLEVQREVATDGGQQMAEDEQDSEDEDEVAVAYRTARKGDLKVETGTVLEDSPYQHRTPQDDEVYVQVERDAGTVYLRVPLQGGNVYALHHATKRHDTRQGRLVDVVDTSEVEGSICMNCREWLDHFTPVNTGHATTGDSGCPHCLEAEGVRSVVHEVGDERTVTGGYVPGSSRDHGSSVTLEAAKAIVEQ